MQTVEIKIKRDFLDMPGAWRATLKRKRMEEKGCSIIIPNWNSKVLLERCLWMVDRTVTGFCRPSGPESPLEVIVVDNGSDKDDSVAYLKAIEEFSPFGFPVSVVYNKENLGFAGGINAGMRAARPGTDVCLLNVDAEPQPGWLEALYGTLIRFPDAGMVGPLGNVVPSGHQREGEFSEDTMVPNLHFFCVLILRDLIDKIGGLDPIYGVGSWDDNDYGSRARFAGFSLYASAGALVRHEAHQVFRLNGLDADKYEHENLLKFTEKMHRLAWAWSRERNLYADARFARDSGLYVPL